jgi:DNA mismatch repair ATPase MutS
MTQVSKSNRFVRPKILDPISAFAPSELDDLKAGTLNIVNGRHPLLEQVMSSHAKSFVANSTKISIWNAQCDLDACLHIVTGPNGSGKSVYLTQMGLIVFMAHIGCFVPADSAEIPVIDHLFTFSGSGTSHLPMSTSSTNSEPSRSDTNTASSSNGRNDSLAARSSANSLCASKTGSMGGSFMNDAHKLGRILRHATPLSLILIDEFGRGTSESDALSLLLAAVHKLCAARPLRTVDSEGRNVDSEGSPKTLVSTHLKITNAPSLSQLGQKVKCFHMNVILPDDTSHSNARNSDLISDPFRSLFLTPTFLYQLTPTVDDFQVLQLGLFCAKIAGMPIRVLERARSLKMTISKNQPIYPIGRCEDSSNISSRENRSISEEASPEVTVVLRELEANFGRASLTSMATSDALSFLQSAESLLSRQE